MTPYPTAWEDLVFPPAACCHNRKWLINMCRNLIWCAVGVSWQLALKAATVPRAHWRAVTRGRGFDWALLNFWHGDNRKWVQLPDIPTKVKERLWATWDYPGPVTQLCATSMQYDLPYPGGLIPWGVYNWETVCTISLVYMGPLF